LLYVSFKSHNWEREYQDHLGPIFVSFCSILNAAVPSAD
jgi:hypothetical protein